MIALVAPDRVGPEMAGTGIRYVEMARWLQGRGHDVRLLAPTGSLPVPGVDLELYDPDSPASPSGFAPRLVIAPPLPPRVLAGLNPTGAPWIVDLYNPEPFEGLEYQRGWARTRRQALDRLRIDRISFAIRRGSAFLCASERQRDMWLGYLAASRKLDSDRYQDDRLLARLLAVVPSGLPSDPPASTDPVLRGKQFPADARIMVWNGGLWDWLDPGTVIRALGLLVAADDRWRLAFNTTQRPSHRAQMDTPARAIALASELSLESHIHFQPGAMAYADRSRMLSEGDVGVSAHPATLESRFAFRVRMLDYVWTGLPILCTSGDTWSEIVDRERLGEVVAPEDPQAFADAAARIADHPEAYRAGLEAAARRFQWPSVLAPLDDLIEHTLAERSAPKGVLSRAYALRHGAAALAERTVRAVR